MYADRYQEYQKAIQQSSQMVASCHGIKSKKLVKKINNSTSNSTRNNFLHRSETAERQSKKIDNSESCTKSCPSLASNLSLKRIFLFSINI